MEAKWESERVRELVPSATIDLGDRIKRLRASGHDVLNLISGAPEFDTPTEIKREAHAAIDEDYRYMTYSLSAGLEDLRRVIADKLRGENGIDADPEHLIVTVGTKEGIALATQACLDPGDEVLLLTPGWVTYDALVRLAGAEPVSVPLRKGGGPMLTGDDLAARITSRTRAILLNTPTIRRVASSGRPNSTRSPAPPGATISSCSRTRPSSTSSTRTRGTAASRPSPAWPSAPSPSTASPRRSRWPAGGSATCTGRLPWWRTCSRCTSTS